MDLKNIELNKINNEQIVAIAIISITLFISFKIYKTGVSNFDLLQAKKNSEVQKNTVLAQIKQSEEVLNSYNKKLEKKDLSETIDIINTIAEKSGIKIHSLRPMEKEDYPVYQKFPFDIKFETSDYHLIGKFVRNLENHPSLFFINLLEINRGSGIGMQEERQSFKVELTLSVFVYKG